MTPNLNALVDEARLILGAYPTTTAEQDRLGLRKWKLKGRAGELSTSDMVMEALNRTNGTT